MHAAYENAEALEQEVRRRGVDEVAEDVAIASDWSLAGGEASSFLNELGLVLERERIHLTGYGRSADDEMRFAQQMHWRAVQTGLVSLASKFAASLEHSASPRFLAETAVPTDDPALIRSARGPLQHETFTTIRAVQVHAASGSIVTMSWRSAVIWQIDRMIPLRSFSTSSASGYLEDALLASSGDELLTIDSNCALIAWNAHTGEMLRETSLQLPPRTHRGYALRHAQFTPDGSTLLAAYDNRERASGKGTAVIARWEVAQARMDKLVKLGAHWVNAAGIDENGRLAATPGAEKGTVDLWDLDSRERLRVFHGYSRSTPSSYPARFSSTPQRASW